MEVFEHVLVIRGCDVRALMPAVKAGLAELQASGRLHPSTAAACQRLNDFRLADSARLLASGHELSRESTRVEAGSVLSASSVEALAEAADVTVDRVRQFLRKWDDEHPESRLPRDARNPRKWGLVPATVAADFLGQSLNGKAHQ